LNRVVDPAGSEATLGYGNGGLLTSISGPISRPFSVDYDNLGRATRMTDPLSGAWNVAYVDVGGSDAMTTATSPVGDVAHRIIALEGNGDSRLVINHPDGTATTQLRPKGGGIISTRPDGTVVTIRETGDPRFRAQTRVAESVTVAPPGLAPSRMTFGQSVVLATPTDPLSMTQLKGTWTLNGDTYTRVYDTATRRLTATSPENRVSLLDLDPVGRILRQEVPGLVPRTNSYDPNGRLKQVEDGEGTAQRRTRLNYSPRGELAELIDPTGRTNRIEYDLAGEPSRIVLPDGSAVGIEVDREHRLSGVTPPGRPRHGFEYNAAGELSRYTPPRVGGDDSVVLRYDLARELVAMDLPDGQKLEHLRGPGGRFRQSRLGAGAVIDFGYDAKRGLLTNVTSSTGEGLALDFRGSLPFFNQWSGVVTGVVSLQFNAAFQPSAVEINGVADALVHDRDGVLVQAGLLSIGRDPESGRETTNVAGVVSEERTHNPRGLLATHRIVVAGTAQLSVALKYDAVDRITNRVEETPDGIVEHAYEYEANGRLSRVWTDGVVSVSYAYDLNGNRTARNGESALYDAQDRLLSQGDTTVGWSRNGHRISRTAGDQTTGYAYDVRGVLTGVSLPGRELEYVLDPLGRRIGVRSEGALVKGWLWWQDRIVAEVGPDSAVTARFIYGADILTPALMVRGTNTYRIVSDERSSVRRVIHVADGTVVQALDYDEFGRVLRDTNPGFQPFGFGGGHHDPDTGLVRFGLRDYDPETGQWMARDPILFGGGQGSLYAYVGNDPVNRLDPMGTGPWDRAYRFAKGGLGVVASFVSAGAAGTLLGVATGPALVVAGFLFTTSMIGAYGSSYNLVNAVIDPASSDIPTSLGAGIAYISGNHPDAQRVGAIYDIITGWVTGNAATAALGTTYAVSAAVTRFGNFNSLVGAGDSAASAYGLTPGSAPLTPKPCP
jgi:RHS repeat-associated protein